MPTLPNSEITVTGNGTVHIVHTGELHLHFNLNGDDRVLAKLGQMDAKLDAASGELTQMAHTVDEVISKIAAQTTDIASVKTLVEGLKVQVAAIPGIPADVQAKIDSVFDSITTNNATLESLTAAVTTPGTGAVGANPV